MSAPTVRLLFYAPNVHSGGGLVLLQYLLKCWPKDYFFFAWLDLRARDQLELPTNAQVKWVSPSVVSRLKSEFNLAKEAKSNDRILCFHGLPPLLRNDARVLIFQQNRNYLGLVPLKSFGWRTRQRLRFEQRVAHIFRERCTDYWVQTPSMAHELKLWYGEKPVSVKVLPFAEFNLTNKHRKQAEWDFLYVADGEAHKNHKRLVEAWVLLAQQGFKPSLALTLSSRDEILLGWIKQQIKTHGLKITNLGQLPHDNLLTIYDKSRALIFPSISESFGIPLLEARQAGLPIVASELDFVRDVCEPVQSFNPYSANSIVRAVRRFMGLADKPLTPVSAAVFLNSVLGRLD